MNPKDLRYIKTEANLKAALLHLLEKRNIDEISITGLCEAAACSRNTFYQHYQSKDELFNAVMKDILSAIDESTQPIKEKQTEMREDDIREYTYKLLRVINTHRAELMSLRNCYDLFLLFLNDALYKSFLSHYEQKLHINQISEQGKLLTKYFCSGIAGFIEQWLSDSKVNLNKAQQILDQCTRDNFRKMRDILIDAK